MKTGSLMKQFLTALMLSNIADVHTDRAMFRGHAIGGYSPIFTPKHTKLKGYMKENRRSSFNKNR